MNQVDTEDTCNAEITEFFTAMRLCASEGGEFQGKHLLRYRQLPAKEKAYWATLLAPYEDPHVATRTQEVVKSSDGYHDFVYSPPYPEPCACSASVFVDYNRRAARCSRCLSAWPESDKQRCADGARGIPLRRYLKHPLLDSINREDMEHAIERMDVAGHVLAVAFGLSDPSEAFQRELKP